jgi:ubiquinone/menaquinone biosynthesis C-methylase UbiE
MPKEISAIRASGTELPFRDKSVDFSMAWELIHHIEKPEGVFSEMRRVSRKWVVIFEPNRWNPLQAGFSLVVSKERLGLRNSRRYLESLMQNAGLKIIHYACVGWIFPNKSPNWLAEILGRMPFKIPYIGISHLFIAEP